MNRMSTVHDVVVIGAGIAGLTAAVALQRDGHQVLTLERRDKPGGLCGTAILGGYEFTIGCNDFGSMIEKVMRDLGVNITFAHLTSIFYTDNEKYVVPPTRGTALNVLRHSADILRIVCALRAAKAGGRYSHLGQIVDLVRSHDVADLLSMVSYGFGAAPKDFPIDTLLALFSKELDYGYTKPVVPIGGPGMLTDRLATRLADLGGTLRLGTTVERVNTAGPLKAVTTTGGTYLTRHVVSSESRLDLYPPGVKPGLSFGTLHLAVPANAPFPSGVHTVAYTPENAVRWLDRLDNGELPDEFGFNVFPCEFSDSRDYRALTAFLLFPRGRENLDSSERERIEKYLINRLDVLFPGLMKNVLYKILVTPNMYRELHGLSSEAVPAVLPAGFQKPDGYDPRRGVHYVGTSVQPPCEHACSALMSGLRAAAAIQTTAPHSPEVAPNQ